MLADTEYWLNWTRFFGPISGHEANLVNGIINAYIQFDPPKHWGDGKRASADGTKWDLYEQNPLSENHIRCGRYGGIGYYHAMEMNMRVNFLFKPLCYGGANRFGKYRIDLNRKPSKLPFEVPVAREKSMSLTK